ncbi:tripartite tricarboxylate transporter substrate-binding protein [Roseomonas sp. GC11]|uniref:tripartite tricarboxylate transporter substrate-binding protein n=1 Tax=Roseomonas sp. GC11 TaxID=2950546 RepID=UPI00210EDF6D|nr:tripartite tricarboxylate transporter substrate-binding protein [Roseomonas sp. GC11]MCQ4159117.1 tripartite tricarboxylate transporter substrate-binding protein [Roseomonas sp. GC11]
MPPAPLPPFPRRCLLSALGCGLALGMAAPRVARAAAFGSRPVTLVVPFPPGGGVDIIARALAERLAPLLGTPVLVDNRAGGSTSIASALVARAEPDGHTLLLGTPALSINPVFQPALPPGDPRQALLPVGRVATLPYVLVAGPSLPVEDLEGLIAWAKRHPGQLTLANSGAVTAPRLAGDLLAQQAGLAITSVPYKGGAAAALDITSGRVHASFAQTLEALPMLRGGQVRAIAVSGATRSPILPGVPAVAERVPGFEVTSWNGLYAPAGTPAGVVRRLNDALNRAIAGEELRRRFAEEGVEFVGGTPEELAQQLEREITKWTRLRESTNLVLD